MSIITTKSKQELLLIVNLALFSYQTSIIEIKNTLENYELTLKKKEETIKCENKK